MNYLPNDPQQPTQVQVSTINKTDLSFLHKSLIVFGGLCALVATISISGGKGLDYTVEQCNQGYKGACIDLLRYESRWDAVTSEYGQNLIEEHYRTTGR